nr:DUF481 domain-containing protein [uncultured Flavobacterium sp.]
MQRTLLICLACICFCILSVQAQKNDTIYMQNGDRITGELKKFEYGLLSLSTDAMKTISIQFDRINSIHSAKYYEIRMNSGQKYFGRLKKSNVMSSVDILTVTDTIPKRLWDIVLIVPIKRSFFQKIDGSFDLGLTYTKASDIFQYSLNTKVTYRATYYATQFKLESLQTYDGTQRSKNNTIGFMVSHFLPNKWQSSISVQVQQNTQLDLDYRAQAGYAMGYDVSRTNSIRFNVMGGLLANQEKTISAATTSENLEAVLSAQFKWFKYRSPKIDITTGLEVFPSVTNIGRVRLEYDLAAKYELVKDFFLNVQIYENYDSQPSKDADPLNDWGIITSIGFTF